MKNTVIISLALAFLFLFTACHSPFKGSGPRKGENPNLIISLAGAETAGSRARFSYPVTNEFDKMYAEVTLEKGGTPNIIGMAVSDEGKLALSAVEPGDYKVSLSLYYGDSNNAPLLAKSDPVEPVSVTVVEGEIAQTNIIVYKQFKVTGVIIDPEHVPVAAGTSWEFTAAVSFTDLLDEPILPEMPQDVIWSVSGGIGSDTGIDATTGLLTVALNEEVGSTLTVTATSKMDPTESGTATVEVTHPPIVLTIVASGSDLNATPPTYTWNEAVTLINGGGNGTSPTNPKVYSIIVNEPITIAGTYSSQGYRTFTADYIIVHLSGSGSITLSGTGSLLRISANQAVTMTGLILEGHNYNNASLVHIEGGTFTMNGGEIRGNNSNVNSNSGGVNLRSDGIFTMNGGEIKGNTAGQYGGGVDVTGGTFYMTDGEIKGNTAGQGGGGVYLWGSGQPSIFEMSGGIIGGVNPADANIVVSDAHPIWGGGVYLVSGGSTFTMSGSAKVTGNIVRNTYNSEDTYNAQAYGGGVCAEGTFIMNGGEVSNNTVASALNRNKGGGVHVQGTFTMNGGKISGNDAYDGGGVSVSAFANSIFNMDGVTAVIAGNTAANNGGGVMRDSGAINLTNGTIYGSVESGVASGLANTAANGVALYGTATLTGGPSSIGERNNTIRVVGGVEAP